jgi:hypothetical protein
LLEKYKLMIPLQNYIHLPADLRQQVANLPPLVPVHARHQHHAPLNPPPVPVQQPPQAGPSVCLPFFAGKI